MNRSKIFLKAYEITGSITRAAQAARIDRSMHYRRMKTDKAYAVAFKQAHEIAIGAIEDEMVRRAVEGIQKPVIWQGMLSYQRNPSTGAYLRDKKTKKLIPLVVREYSDSLLQFLLRGEKPEKYRERHQHTHDGNVDLKFQGPLTELLALYRKFSSDEAEASEPKKT